MLVPSIVRHGHWQGRACLWAIEPGYLDSVWVQMRTGQLVELALWVGWAED
jgi:hypothetical protein